MADPTVLTAVIGAIAGTVSALFPIWMERRHAEGERKQKEELAASQLAGSAKAFAGTSVESWEKLVAALNHELQRLQDDAERGRRDAAELLDQQRAEYEAQLAAARQRITELEGDVISLKRIISPRQGRRQ